MDPYPTELSRTQDGIRIVWSDGMVQELSARRLRASCPCATCRERRREAGSQEPLPVVASEEAAAGIARMQPVGNYAYQIIFEDGHDTGIFTFDHLRALHASPEAQK